MANSGEPVLSQMNEILGSTTRHGDKKLHSFIMIHYPFIARTVLSATILAINTATYS